MENHSQKKLVKSLLSNHTELELFTSAFTYAAIGMAIVDISGKWIKVNQSLCDLVEYSEEELTSLSFQDITHPSDLQEDLFQLNRLLNKEIESYQLEKRYITKSGNTVYILLSVSLIRDNSGNPSFFISQIQNISNLKAYESELLKLISQDYLTKIGNRRHFYEHAERELKRSARTRLPVSLLMIDIDRFKRINDNYGHQAGDEVLKSISLVIKKAIRPMDILGRIGGEEFAVLLPETNRDESYIVAERLRNIVAATEFPRLNLSHVTISIGTSTFSGDEKSIDTRMLQTDSALYRAKKSGRNRTESYVDPEESEPIVTNQPFASFINLTWNKSFESGHAVLDSQHIKLFETANLLLSSLIRGDDHVHSNKLIDQLIIHINKHFEFEESLLETIEYPSVEQHSMIHRNLISRLNMLKIEYHDNFDFLDHFFSFLFVDVVQNHLIHEDAKFFNLLRKKP